MEKKTIKISDKTYNIVIVKSDVEKAKGLQDFEKLPEDEGMLFLLDDDDKDEDNLVWFWMKDTKIPLDIIFLDEDYEVTSITKGEPLSETPIYGEGDYVLEVNPDSGINIGDELEFVESEDESGKMHILDSKGDTQIVLEGGERIFSIPNTKILIKFAKKADLMKNDNAYKALGKRVFKFLTIQDSNPVEYVEQK